MTTDIATPAGTLRTILTAKGLVVVVRGTGSGHHTLTIGKTVVWIGPELLRWHDGARWRFHPVADLDGAARALAELGRIAVPRPREAMA